MVSDRLENNRTLQTPDNLHRHLSRIDGKGYPAYKDIRGRYRYADFDLFIDHVQGDPFAAPSRVRVRVSQAVAQFPHQTQNNSIRIVALRDYLARAFSRICLEIGRLQRGSGKSGLIAMPRPGQQILMRSSVMITEGYVEARFVVGLPAQGRRILGRQAQKLFGEIIPQIVAKTLKYDSLDVTDLKQHLDCAEDADFLRQHLSELGLVAFIANGSCLPRQDGDDDRPLADDQVVLFETPESLRVNVSLPHRGEVSGMGIPKGVTLIVGGGYHGKSTLLNVLERGIYNHIPSDGRELVVTDPTAVKIRAEDGRRVTCVDISPFITHLPNGGSTTAFSSDNASGSTSQAANIVEAIEMGAKTLLLDEDTCATNFMIRDARMQTLVAKSSEPITPFVDRVRQLSLDHNVSSMLVLGGSGDYFEVADTVIQVDHYRPQDVTAQAKSIARSRPTGRQIEDDNNWTLKQPQRVPRPESLNPRKGKRAINIKGRGQRAILYGVEEIDLSFIAQIIDDGQVNAIGQALGLLFQMAQQNSGLDIVDLIATVMDRVTNEDLDGLDARVKGDYVLFRRFELAAALNRLRTLQIKC